MADHPQRFVILHHTGWGPEHWDLMLEHGPTLATWKLYHPPQLLHQGPLELERLGDHRIEYLNYEGPVSGHRGQVRCVCAGVYSLLKKESDCWQVRLRSDLVNGRFEIQAVTGHRWRIVALAAKEGNSSTDRN